jgi:uncharacterized membrane protein
MSVLIVAGCTKLPQYPNPSIKDDSVVINTPGLQEKLPEFYTVEFNDGTANFFVLKVSGNVESYFDACIRCYKDKEGYRAEGGSIVCRACGVTYPLDMLKDGFGSCHPIQLQGEINGDQYIISLDDIKKGTKYF